VVESGNTEALFEKRAHPYTQGLFAARPTLGFKRGTRLQTIPGNVPDIFNWPGGCAFANRCTHAQDTCRQTMPALELINATDTAHWVRCPLWQDLGVSA
jgi:peptide/nickel transport system ATP-binding protein